jgi:hypothetical protein
LHHSIPALVTAAAFEDRREGNLGSHISSLSQTILQSTHSSVYLTSQNGYGPAADQLDQQGEWVGRAGETRVSLMILKTQLQDVFSSIGVNNNIVRRQWQKAQWYICADLVCVTQDLPQIAVIGSQSSGKSSVLEVSSGTKGPLSER